MKSRELSPILPTSLRDRVALVTGSGRGIGAATAEALAERGARVYLCSRTASEVEGVISRLQTRFGSERIQGKSIDLANPDSLVRLFDQVEESFGECARILVNNAAVGYVTDFLETSSSRMLEIWEEIQKINMRAPYLLSHEFMRRIAAASATADDRGGAIVNIGSLGGIRGTEKFPGLSAYVASKFAVAGMTEALAVEGKPIGVRVNAVAPGAVATEMLRKAAPHLRTETTPADVAKIIAYLCDSQESGALSGTILEIHSNLE